jgi:predicted XRE-type DNA-binding protein
MAFALHTISGMFLGSRMNGWSREPEVARRKRQRFQLIILIELPLLRRMRKRYEMAKRISDGTEVDTSIGNVFADPGRVDAEKLKIKSALLIEITRAVRKLGLTQDEAAKRMGVPQPKVSSMLRGDFSNLSERKLMGCLNRLGYDIEIKVKPAQKAVGHLTLAVARRQAN